MSKLETTVQAKMNGAIVPFNLDEKNPCIAGNLTCPLTLGETNYFYQTVKILPQYPKVKTFYIKNHWPILVIL